MSFSVIDCEQRSDTWRQARAGRITGSKAECVTAKVKTGEALTRRDYRYRIALERITKLPESDDYVSFDMRRGIEMEPMAIAAYGAYTGLPVSRSGFISHDSLPIGCSLDGSSDNFERILELKSAKASAHIRRWNARDEFVREHWQQIAHCLWVTGAKSCDLASFNPYVPAKLRLLVANVDRSDARIPEYIDAAERFLADIEDTVREVQALAEAAP